MKISTYPIRELLNLWLREAITVEQAIGHILEHLLLIEKRLGWDETRPPPEFEEDERREGTGDE